MKSERRWTVSPEDLVFAPVFLPLLGSALVFCAQAFFKKTPSLVLEYLGVGIGLALPWAVFIYTMPIVLSGHVIEGVIGGWHAQIGIAYRFDGLAWLVNVLSFSLCTAAWCYTLGAGPKEHAFSAVYLILTASLAAVTMTADLFNLFVCLEVMGIASYILVASSSKPAAALASFSYLMISAASMVFFLTGVYGLYRLTGSLSYAGIAAGLQQLPDGGGTAALVSLAMIVSAVAVRVAVMPVSGWLPDAHAMAPHAVSAVLSGVLIKVPLFALLRVMMIMPAGARAGLLIGYAGAVTAVIGVVMALSQADAKRLLAYHSISQIGYVVSAWGAALYVGVTTSSGIILMAASFIHAYYHALFKGLLFLSVGTTADCTGSRNVYTLRNASRTLRIWGERIPVTTICFFVGALAISAVPPFNGFASKAALSYALKGSPHYYLLALAGVGTTASFIKLSRIYWPHKGSSATPGTVRTHVRVHWAVHLSQIFLALLCIIGGIAAPYIFTRVSSLIAQSGESAGAAFSLYTPETIIKTVLITVSGIGLFLLSGTRSLSRVLTRFRERHQTFQGLFVSFSLAAAVLAAWMIM